MKNIKIIILLILITFGLNAQNWNPNGENSATGNLTLDGAYLDLIIPNTYGYWARGFFNVAPDKVTRIGGVGLLGQGSSTEHYYMAYGEAPWNSGKGLYVKTDGNVGVGITNPSGKLHVNGETYIENGWIRVKGKRGIYFQDYGGGLYMQDNTWIRTYGNKNFYHNTGIMRTDGRLEVGPTGNRFVVNQNGFVGIGTTNPSQKLDVNGAIQSKSMVLIDSNYGSNSDFTALYREDAGNDNAVVKLRIGDDVLGSLNVGYKYWSTGEWISTFYVNNYGKVGIGTTTPDAKLTVKGKIHAEEVKIDLSVPAPDYVFKKDYNLLTIEEVRQHILEKGHLPNIPSATTMETEGVDLGTMNMKLLEKIEELTLYTIAQEKEIKELKKVKAKNKELEARLAKIEALIANTKNR